MCKLRRVNIERSDAVLAGLEVYKERLIAAVNPSAIVLFGSLGRDDANEGSDVDILVVADFVEPFLDRIGRLLELGEGLGLPLEPLGYRPEEIVAMLERGNAFIPEVLRSGRVIHGTIPEVQQV